MFTSLRKAARVLFFAFAFSAIVYSAAAVVHAELFFMECRNGSCFWLSCGGSAGAYYYSCDQATNVCDDCETDACNQSAAQQCHDRGYDTQLLWQ